MDFIADQLVGLFDAHFRSGIHFTADQIARRFGFIDSYAGDLPAMLGTLLSAWILRARVAS